MHAAEAAVLLLDRQAHPCLLIYAVLAQTCDVQDIARLYTWRIQVIKVKKNRNMCKSNCQKSSLILPYFGALSPSFLNFAGWRL